MQKGSHPHKVVCLILPEGLFKDNRDIGFEMFKPLMREMGDLMIESVDKTLGEMKNLL